ncbi:MAG: C4-dicarboxylate transporter DcuC [Bacteroidales bacterium]|nr:C4-dicarboxylate transporter DcuC [Bacteroidales bacterium]MDT8432381.1 C4-dicarboxylate transporter DcuC [Bacteroidales bacterium]
MQIVGIILAVQFTIVTAYLLFRKYNPQAVLLFSGLLMLALALIIGFPIPDLQSDTGFEGFNLFAAITESFASKGAGVGLMIMTIGGFVSYMKKIGASDALVYISMQPLSLFKKHPYIAASLVIPIGQLLFICTPSATGLGLLLVASIFPVLVSLGISRLSAVSVITACTVFDMGPASANTARAAELIGKNNVEYFLEHQLSLTIPLTIFLMIIYYFINRHADKKMGHNPEKIEQKDFQANAPLIYGILPILPLILLIIFSSVFSFTNPPIVLDTTTAMIMSMVVAFIFELIRIRSIKKVFSSLKIFWEGMGKVFASVITLIVCAEIFSRGLISLGFIEGLVQGSQAIGFGAIGIGVIMTIMIFTASILMGSGNASFFSFGPLVPDIATKLGVEGVSIILPMQLASSMGRATSPISGVVIATSEIAGVSPFDLAKRNFIPLVSALVIMLFYYSIF